MTVTRWLERLSRSYPKEAYRKHNVRIRPRKPSANHDRTYADNENPNHEMQTATKCVVYIASSRVEITWSDEQRVVRTSTDNIGHTADTLLEILIGQETSLARGVSHEDTLLLGALDKRLVVAANAIAHGNKGKIVFVKDVAVFRSEFEEFRGESVVVVLLLKGVVEGRVTQVLFAVRNKKAFELQSVCERERSKESRVIRTSG